MIPMKIVLFQNEQNTTELEDVSKRAFGETEDSDISKWFSFDEMKKAIESQTGACLMANSDDDKLLGYIYAQQESPINGAEGSEKWVIVMTAVDPEFAGQGVGSFLLREIEKEAKSRDAKKMFVYTNKGADKVVDFYKKNGYSDAGWIKDYQYGSDNSAVFLLKHLS
jgi:ribosomal protein S18 acetylase RimI-like enzyme